MFSSVAAYSILFGYLKFDSYQLDYQYIQNGLISYSNMINDAVYKWNVTDISTGRVTSGGDFKIYSDDYGNVSWAGKCWYPCIPNLLIGCKIKLNEYALGTDGYYAINVTLHELGHMYGLDHSSYYYSVMKPIADPNILYPNLDDKNGVNSIY